MPIAEPVCYHADETPSNNTLREIRCCNDRLSLPQQAAQVLFTYPIAAVQAAYAGIKNALALFGIPLPFAATKPTAAAPVAAAVAPTAAEVEATSTTDEQAPAAPRAAVRGRSTTTSGSEGAGTVRRAVAPSVSAVQPQHDSADSTSTGQSETKQSDAKQSDSSHSTGGSRANRHNAA